MLKLWKATKTAGTIASLLFFVLSICLWCRSHYAMHTVSWGTPYDNKAISLWVDRISINHQLFNLPDNVSGKEWMDFSSNPPHDYPTFVILESPDRKVHAKYTGYGFTLYWHVRTKPGILPATTEVRAIAFPIWWLVALFGLAPLIWLIRRIRRARKIPAGHCRNCRYDLRAGHAVCPECGLSTT
jgi:hypothetical protein